MARDIQFVREIIARMGGPEDILIFELPSDGPATYLIRRFRRDTNVLAGVALYLNPSELTTDDTRIATNVAHELGHITTDRAPHNIKWLIAQLPMRFQARAIRVYAVPALGPWWDLLEELLEAVTMRRTRVEIQADLNAAGLLARIEVPPSALIQRLDDEWARANRRSLLIRWLMRLRYARQKHMLLARL